MKKHAVLVIFIMVTFIAATLVVLGNSAEDYKVIKKAVNNGTSTEITWFRIEVTDKKTNKSEVKIKIPVSVIELLADSVKDEIEIKDKCHLDLKKILAELKKYGPMTLIEVDEEDTLVKIWFE